MKNGIVRLGLIVGIVIALGELTMRLLTVAVIQPPADGLIPEAPGEKEYHPFDIPPPGEWDVIESKWSGGQNIWSNGDGQVLARLIPHGGGDVLPRTYLVGRCNLTRTEQVYGKPGHLMLKVDEEFNCTPARR